MEDAELRKYQFWYSVLEEIAKEYHPNSSIRLVKFKLKQKIGTPKS